MDVTGFIPTQPTATLDTTLGQALASYLGNYRVGFEQYWVAAGGCRTVGQRLAGRLLVPAVQ